MRHRIVLAHAHLVSAFRAGGLTGGLFAALVVGLSGCIGEIEEKPRVVLNTAIESRPIESRCRVTDGTGRGATVVAPGLASLSTFEVPVRVVCRKNGYWPEEVRIVPRRKRPLLIRLLEGERVDPRLGDVRGNEAGIGGEFPSRILMRLAPASFDSEADRDVAYAALVQETRADWAVLGAQAEAECEAGVVGREGASAVSLPANCRRAFEILVQQRADDLRRIEGLRRRSAVP
jgi:hypothetical protein